MSISEVNKHMVHMAIIVPLVCFSGLMLVDVLSGFASILRGFASLLFFFSDL